MFPLEITWHDVIHERCSCHPLGDALWGPETRGERASRRGPEPGGWSDGELTFQELSILGGQHETTYGQPINIFKPYMATHIYCFSHEFFFRFKAVIWDWILWTRWGLAKTRLLTSNMLIAWLPQLLLERAADPDVFTNNPWVRRQGVGDHAQTHGRDAGVGSRSREMGGFLSHRNPLKMVGWLLRMISNGWFQGSPILRNYYMMSIWLWVKLLSSQWWTSQQLD